MSKYKKKITSLSRDGSAKKLTNKSLGMIINEVHPYIFSYRNIVA